MLFRDLVAYAIPFLFIFFICKNNFFDIHPSEHAEFLPSEPHRCGCLSEEASMGYEPWAAVAAKMG